MQCLLQLGYLPQYLDDQHSILAQSTVTPCLNFEQKFWVEDLAQGQVGDLTPAQKVLAEHTDTA